MQTPDDGRSFHLLPMRHPNNDGPRIMVRSSRFGSGPIDLHPDHPNDELGWGHDQPSALRAAEALLFNVTGDAHLAAAVARDLVDNVLMFLPASTEHTLHFDDLRNWAKAQRSLQYQ